MEGWHVDLARGVKDALGRRERTKIAVHSEVQAELARRAAARMAANDLSLDASHVVPELIPESEQDIYFVGAILV